jgi:hypothetical protein
LLLIISGGINNSIIISWSMFIAAKWQTPYGRGEETVSTSATIFAGKLGS